jgi:glutamate-1-semialdehyde 2,1-aminomutase
MMRESATTSRSSALFARAKELLPGGVNSPVRAFRKVGGEPFFVDHGRGAKLHDVDGASYIDYVMSWGALMLGHAHAEVIEAVRDAAGRGTSYGAPCAAEVELAALVTEMMPAIEMVRFVNSGTEATMSALRLARAVTGRDMLLKFSGNYHGHGDSFLVQAGSGVATLGLPDSPGVPAGLASLTLTAPFNDSEAVRDVFAAHGDRIACIIVEPVCGNAGFIAPVPGFLPALREVADTWGALLVLDEVMTGFRVAEGGAQERFGVRADLTTLGKVIGGGLPVGAYGGRRDLMERIAPAGDVYQAGTLSGNPLAMAAGLAQLRCLRREQPWAALERSTRRLVEGIVTAAHEAGVAATGGALGAMGGWFFHPGPIRCFEDAANLDHELFGRFFHACLRRGVFLPPSPYEALFLSTAHDDETVDVTLEVVRSAMAEATA